MGGLEVEGIELISMPVTASNETQLVVQSLLNQQIDAFFALPDNIVFSSMEVIDLLGKTLLKRDFDAQSARVEVNHGLASGSYFCRIQTLSGACITLPFVVTK